VRLNGLVLDLILDAISNAGSQLLAATVDLIKQDARSNFVMKLALCSYPFDLTYFNIRLTGS